MRLRHYGRYVGQFCISSFGPGPGELVRVVGLSEGDNNRCFVDCVTRPEGEKREALWAVCEWLEPWYSPGKPVEKGLFE